MAEDAIAKVDMQLWESEVLPGLVRQMVDHPPETDGELDLLMDFWAGPDA